MKRTPLKRQSSKNRQVRGRDKRWWQAVLERDGYCQMCKATHQLDAHHIFTKQAFPAWRWVLENGICLCRKCHGYVHLHNLDLLIDEDALRAEFMAGVGTIIE